MAVDKEAKRIFDLPIEQQSEELNDIFDRMIYEEKNPNKDNTQLLLQISLIRTSFFGTTSSGLVLSFLSYDDFPKDIFKATDVAYYSTEVEEFVNLMQNFIFRCLLF